jgi:hypothetical protein
MPETPDTRPRRLVHAKRTLMPCIGGRGSCMMDRLAATAAAVGSISMQTGLSIGGAYHAEKEREGAGAAMRSRSFGSHQVGIANESDQVT